MKFHVAWGNQLRTLAPIFLFSVNVAVRDSKIPFCDCALACALVQAAATRMTKTFV